jgi:DNA-binding protein
MEFVVVSMSDQQDIVLIGKKPAMNYVVACLTLFNAGRQTVTVRARGFVISNAVDAVEVLRRSFIKDLEIQKIAIGSQEFKNANGADSVVSTIDIVISRPKK